MKRILLLLLLCVPGIIIGMERNGKQDPRSKSASQLTKPPKSPAFGRVRRQSNPVPRWEVQPSAKPIKK